LVGCGRTEQHQLGERVDMGPYTFEVAGAKKSSIHISNRTLPSIEVLFRLHRDDTAPYTTDFRHSFMTRMQLVDAAGNTFRVVLQTNSQEYRMDLGGNATPVPGVWRTSREVYRAGRLRSDTYRASVALDPVYLGRGMELRQHENIGKNVSDFRLIIDNPDRTGDQPARVVVQLQ
jgi:hypothetical protein